MGDEVQAIKAGLLEVADIVVVNKGDKPGAQRTARPARAMLVASAAARADGRRIDGATGRGRSDPRSSSRPPRTGDGVPELLAALDRHRAARRGRGAGSARALARAEAQVWAILGTESAAALDGRGSASGAPTRSSARSPTTASTRIAAADRLLPSPRLARVARWPHDDRAGLRGGRRADGPRHRPGPRGDRARTSSCTSRSSPAPRPVATGSPATSTGRSPRASSTRRSATRRWRGSSRPPTSSTVRDGRPRHRGRLRGPRRQAGALARARRRALRQARSSPRTPARSRSTAWPRRSRPDRRARFVGHALLQPGAGHAAHRADPRRGDTDDDVEAAIRALVDELGKQVIVSADRPGFIVNRILMPFLAEAMRAFEEGVGTAEDIDTGARVGLNHPMGPLELADFIGLDVCLDDHAGARRRPRPGALAAAARPRGARGCRPSRPEDRAAASTRYPRERDRRVERTAA